MTTESVAHAAGHGVVIEYGTNLEEDAAALDRLAAILAKWMKEDLSCAQQPTPE